MPAPDEPRPTPAVPAVPGPEVTPPTPSGPKPDPLIGTTVAGRYRVEMRLGEGGMGTVYRVEHTHMRKKLALKVLHREMTSQTEMVARFEREAMAGAHIDHPNIASATDFGKLEDGTFYLVLEYVEGISLRRIIEQGPVAPIRAIRISLQILSALRRAHELGIVHRDLKPENVLLVEKGADFEFSTTPDWPLSSSLRRETTASGRREDSPQPAAATAKRDFVKVLDFGIARVPIGSLGAGAGEREEGPNLTRAGMVYGTPEYMAPEQALGQEVDGRSDVYSVGVMLFEMLAGKRPYDNKDKVALLGQHVAGPIPSLRARNPDLLECEELEQVVTKMMAKVPSERFQSADAVMEALASLDFDGSKPIVYQRMSNVGVREASGAFGAVVVHPLNSPISRSRPLHDPRETSTSGQTATSSSDENERTDTGRQTPAPAVPITVLEAWTRLCAALQNFGVPAKYTSVALGAGLLLAILFILLATSKVSPPPHAVAIAHKGVVVTIPSGSAPSASSSAEVPAIVLADVRARTQAALGRVAMGEVEEGTQALEALSAKYPTDTFVLRSLAQTYSRQKRFDEALVIVKRLLAANPTTVDQPFFDELVDQALTVPSAVEAVFAVLETSKADGGRTLYEIAYEGRGPPQLAARARKSLSDPEVRQLLAAPIRAVVDLRAAPFGCAARREILERHRDVFDATAIKVLRPMLKTTGCGGFFKKDDCWPCLREDKLVEKILAGIDERTTKNK